MDKTSSDYFPIGIKRLVYFFITEMERVDCAVRGPTRQFQSWKG